MISLFILFNRGRSCASRAWSNGRRRFEIRDIFHLNVLQISSSEAVHDFVVAVTLLSKESQLIPLQYNEVLLVTLSLGFEIAMTRVLDDVFL